MPGVVFGHLPPNSVTCRELSLSNLFQSPKALGRVLGPAIGLTIPQMSGVMMPLVFLTVEAIVVQSYRNPTWPCAPRLPLPLLHLASSLAFKKICLKNPSGLQGCLPWPAVPLVLSACWVSSLSFCQKSVLQCRHASIQSSGPGPEPGSPDLEDLSLPLHLAF